MGPSPYGCLKNTENTQRLTKETNYSEIITKTFKSLLGHATVELGKM